MTPQRWKQIDKILQSVLELPLEQRKEFLDATCSGDEALRKEVDSLLASTGELNGFIEAPAIQDVAEQLDYENRSSTISGVFGSYTILSKLGSGGMGEVYMAFDSRLHRRVALKILRSEFTNDPDRIRRFQQEARAISALNHTNILIVHETGNLEGRHFIVTEFIDGVTLRQRIATAALSVLETLEIAIQVSEALGAAHAAGVVHRDIKPENIMLRDSGLVKVLDFGIAKLVERQAHSIGSESLTMVQKATDPGTMMGTPSYMSPEQARGLAVDTQTDIFSLGVVIYEMVGRRLPFEGNTPSDMIASILRMEPRPLSEYSGGVPPELARIVTKALRKERQERYQTTTDLLADLRSLKHELEFQSASAHAEPLNQDTTATMQPTDEHAAVTSARQQGARLTSNLEYISRGLKRHRTGALVVLAFVIIALAAAYIHSSYLANRGAPITSVAVLPFVNTSGDLNMEYISDGISESLINTLSELPQLKVIARGSAFKYKGKEFDADEVAQALGVRAIVTGRVMQRGDVLHVSAEMADIRDKRQVWGEQYSGKTSNMQAVQEEIASRISEKLRLRLSGPEEQHLRKHSTGKAEAYQLYLNGVFHKRKDGVENIRKAFDYFNQAVALDPNFARALAEVAACYRFFAGNGLLDPKEAYSKATVAAQKALEIDETLPDAHLALGIIKFDEWDWSGAEHEFQRAIELSPNLAEAHFRYAQYLPLMGRFTEGLQEIKRAQELDPLWTGAREQEAACFYYAGDYNEAIERFQQFIKLEPNMAFAHIVLGYSYAAKEMYSEAIEEYQKAFGIDGETTSTACFLGYALARSGRRNEAQAILHKLKTTQEYVSPAELAVLYAGLEDKEGALASLELAYLRRDPQMQFLKVDPHYDRLRLEPRFQDIERKVGLTP